MKRILFLTDNFPPESNAPATRTYEHCKEWVEKGLTVTVITGVPNFPRGQVFPGYKNKWRQREIVDGIEVIRVWTFISPNKGFFKRIADFLSYAVNAFFAGLPVETDIIIATSPQFFTAISGSWLSFFKRKKWVMEVRDLWPESIKAVGMMDGKSFMFKSLEWLELKMYSSASKIIVVTDSFKKNLVDKGIPQEKISVVKNGVDLEKFSATNGKDTNLINQLQLNNKFVIGYIGTIGLAHAMDFIVKAFKKLEDERIHLIIIGDGAARKKLEKLIHRLEVSNVSILEAVPKNEISRYITILDVALVNLRKSKVFETVIPSKIFENGAMRKPILIGVEGESKDLIEKFKAGLVFEPENEIDFLEKLNLLANDKQLVNQYGDGAYQLALTFDRKVLAEKMRQEILKVI